MNVYDIPDIRIQGKRWEFALTITDSNNQPRDLTGATVTMAIGITEGGKLAESVATLANQSTGKGKATVVFLPEETAVLPVTRSGRLFYQVDVAYDPTNTDTVAIGSIRIQKSMI